MVELLHIDCMEYMKGLKDKAFDLAIVDPPYGIGMHNSNKRVKPSRPNSYTNYKDFRYKQAEWDEERPTEEYFTELFRVSEAQVIWGANYMNDLLPSGFGWIFWNKMNGENNNFSDGEFAFASKGVQSRYIELSTFHELNGGKDRIHPTQKPVKLYRWLLHNYANTGDKVLDTHLGSGSSAIAAHQMGFDFVGCEIDKDYYDGACKRFKEQTMQQSLFQ